VDLVCEAHILDILAHVFMWLLGVICGPMCT
jgi:hypothetical protein